jgi:hypothetical protein
MAKKRYLEYDKTTGRILSEAFVDEDYQFPEDEYGRLEVALYLAVDFARYAVKDGEIVLAVESEIEREERLARVAAEQAQRKRRMREIVFDFVMAQLEDDATRQGFLKAEYNTLKSRL